MPRVQRGGSPLPNLSCSPAVGLISWFNGKKRGKKEKRKKKENQSWALKECQQGKWVKWCPKSMNTGGWEQNLVINCSNSAACRWLHAWRAPVTFFKWHLSFSLTWMSRKDMHYIIWMSEITAQQLCFPFTSLSKASPSFFAACEQKWDLMTKI